MRARHTKGLGTGDTRYLPFVSSYVDLGETLPTNAGLVVLATQRCSLAMARLRLRFTALLSITFVSRHCTCDTRLSQFPCPSVCVWVNTTKGGFDTMPTNPLARRSRTTQYQAVQVEDEEDGGSSAAQQQQQPQPQPQPQPPPQPQQQPQIGGTSLYEELQAHAMLQAQEQAQQAAQQAPQPQPAPQQQHAPAVPPPPGAANRFIVTVPPGVMPGQQLVVQAPNGMRMIVAVPPSCVPGSKFQVAFDAVLRSAAQQQQQQQQQQQPPQQHVPGPAPVPPPQQQNPELVQALLDMGFTADQASRASLRASTVESATEWILAHGTDSSVPAAAAPAAAQVPSAAPPPASSSAVSSQPVTIQPDLELASNLHAMGFDYQAAMEACCETGNNPEAALLLLTKPSTQSDEPAARLQSLSLDERAPNASTNTKPLPRGSLQGALFGEEVASPPLALAPQAAPPPPYQPQAPPSASPFDAPAAHPPPPFDPFGIPNTSTGGRQESI